MKDNLINALLKARAEINNPIKDGVNSFFKSPSNPKGSEYATLEAVIEAVKQPLLDNGVLFQQESRQAEGGIAVETVFYGHGDSLATGAVFVPASNSPHAHGSAMTYARRYSLAMACGVGSDQDVDGNPPMATKKTSATKAKSKRPIYTLLNAKGGKLADCIDAAQVLATWKANFGDPEDGESRTLYARNYKTMQTAFETLAEGDSTLTEAQELQARFKKGSASDSSGEVW